MTRESSQWLNQNVLVGYTDKRGHAWHYKASDQGEESNHYAGAIPVADILRRLFNWQAIELPVSVQVPASLIDATGIDGAGNGYRNIVLGDRKAIARSDTNAVMGLFKTGYQPHQYREWLLENVATILGDELAPSSAGLLKGGAVAWVEISVPDNILTPEGVEFRPNLLACTSFDGSLSTTYKRTVQLTVCDNTMSAALSEDGQEVKVRHSKYSTARLESARDALAIVHDTAEAFTEEIARLCAQEVTALEWERVLGALIPTDNTVTSSRANTIAANKREEIVSLYEHDRRVSPWKGTAFGVLQAFNTYNHHVMATRGDTIRAERNMLNAINGTTETADKLVIDTLGKVLQGAIVVG